MKLAAFASFAAIAGAASLSVAAPALADDHVDAPSLQEVLAHERRSDDGARDQYRNPVETLAFFQVEPTMTVAEYGPGGGWYTRVLAPYIAPQGRYIAMNGGYAYRNLTSEQLSNARGWAPGFPRQVQEWTGLVPARVTAMTSDDVSDSNAGTVDRILIFRSLHGMRNAGVADTELRRMRTLLADDGMIGVVQHRAPESETWERSNGSRGYLKQSDVIKLFQLNGFELVSTSEINANPNDTASWDSGVWTLPPTYTLGDTDRDRYTAVGESDRMTLLFRKAR